MQLETALQSKKLRAQLLLIHDELVVKMAPDALEATQNLMAQTIKNVMKFNKPPEAESGLSKNWTGANQGTF